MKSRKSLPFAVRLKEIRERAGYRSQQSFADAFGIAQSTVGGWESGAREPNHETTIRLAEFFGVSVDYLLGRAVDNGPSCVCQGQTHENPGNVVIQDFHVATWDKKSAPSLSDEALTHAEDYERLDAHGRRVVRVVTAAELERMSEAAPEAEKEPVYIRHYLTPAAAGHASPIEGEDYELIERTTDVPSEADFCLDISGDSMEPYIHDGQRVYVQRGVDVEEYQPGAWYVDGDVYVKQWCVDGYGNLYLLSANPERYDANITILRDSGRRVVCFGRVILPKKLPRPTYIKK